MPSPDVYDDGVIDPFTDTSKMKTLPYNLILYATDRKPSNENEKNRFYSNDRGGVLRLGVGRVEFACADLTWEEARRISLAKNRTDKYSIRVSDVEEYDILDRSAVMLAHPDELGDDPQDAAKNRESTAGNGHDYFRRSPWASSDILITLAYGLSPTDRGLVRAEGSPIWTFPSDYVKRLQTALTAANPKVDLKVQSTLRVRRN